MDVSQSRFAGQDPQPKSAPVTDPRLQPTPDYGTLGPGSDIAKAADRSHPSAALEHQAIRPGLRRRNWSALCMLAANVGNAHAAWSRFSNLFSGPQLRPSRLAIPANSIA